PGSIFATLTAGPSEITWPKSIRSTKRAPTRPRDSAPKLLIGSRVPTATSSVSRWKRQRPCCRFLALRRRPDHFSSPERLGSVEFLLQQTSLIRLGGTGAMADLELVAIGIFKENGVIAGAVFD